MSTKLLLCSLATSTLLLAACQHPQVELGSFSEVNPPANIKPLTMHFENDRLSGHAGCNNMMGQYSINKGALKVSQLATTAMACPPLQMERERDFSRFLQSEPSISFKGSVMTLQKDGVQYQFSRL